MGAALAITRTDHTAGELRAAACKSTDGGQVRRLLALALVLEGHRRSEAAAHVGMDRQTLCDWVSRYNADGIAGLTSRTSPGRPRVLSETQMGELKAMVIKGPDPAVHKVVRWRCQDLVEEVDRRFAVRVHPSTMGKWLRWLDLTRLQPRPCHPKKAAGAEEAFKKVSPPCSGRRCAPVRLAHP